jgi:two-component system LytT family response regulator
MAPERLRLLVADDEPLARQVLAGYLRAIPDVEIAGECGDGDALAQALARQAPDVLLLDVRMPGRDVFEVLKEATAAGAALPAVVFTTAYDAYAVRAFELNAVDYLVKPFTEERLRAALERARARRGSGEASSGLHRLIEDLRPRPDYLLVPDRGRRVTVAVADITWIKAEGDYSRLHAGGQSFLVPRTLADLERRLDARHFLRIHRSAIVRADQIQEVHPEGSSRYRLVLRGGTTLIVSRSYAALLKDWML